MSGARTPEVWSVLDNRDNPHEKGRVFVVADGARTVAEIAYQLPDKDGETLRMSYASLIAAAPALLEALTFAVRFFDQLTPADAERMRAAITKATERAA